MKSTIATALKNPVITLKAEARANHPTLSMIDWPLLCALGAIVLLGVVMVLSASMPFAEKNYNDPFYFTLRQLIMLTAGVYFAMYIARTPVDQWERWGPYLLVFAILLLIIVLIPGIGREVNGSRRWLNFGFVTVQVSEAVKLFIIVYLAGYLVRRSEKVKKDFGAFARPLVLICLVGALLMLEPDFGATVVIVVTSMGMLFVGGVRFTQFLALIASFFAVGVLAIYMSPYRMRRFTSFLDPWADPYNDGFQLSQSLIAIGSGSWKGAGLGNSVQKLFYLPESHTDFVFAVFAEETGLIGVTLLVSLFAFVVWRCLRIAARAESVGNQFAGYVALGIGIWIGFQAFINMGVNMGMLPTKGITLPLVSYGGSSVVVTCIAFALLLRIEFETRRLMASQLRRRQTASAGEVS